MYAYKMLTGKNPVGMYESLQSGNTVSIQNDMDIAVVNEYILSYRIEWKLTWNSICRCLSHTAKNWRKRSRTC